MSARFHPYLCGRNAAEWLINMKLHYIKANPSGNTTVFILDPVPKEQYAQVSKAVLSYENVGAEQLGFIIHDESCPNGWRMEMAGGEFCGNASRSFAAWLGMCGQVGAPKMLSDPEMELTISVSGSSQPLVTQLKRMECDNCCYVTVHMPLPLRILTGNDPWFGEYSLVIFDGISHMVLWNHEEHSEDVEKMKAFLSAVGPMPEAFGLMYFNEAEHRMKPLVYVDNPRTLVWENSCGSGSSAVASALAHRKKDTVQDILLRQPGGDLRLSAVWDKESVTELILGGVIQFTAFGELFA